jgi:hypothetical protein
MVCRPLKRLLLMMTREASCITYRLDYRYMLRLISADTPANAKQRNRCERA